MRALKARILHTVLAQAAMSLVVQLHGCTQVFVAPMPMLLIWGAWCQTQHVSSEHCCLHTFMQRKDYAASSCLAERCFRARLANTTTASRLHPRLPAPSDNTDLLKKVLSLALLFSDMYPVSMSVCLYACKVMSQCTARFQVVPCASHM